MTVTFQFAQVAFTQADGERAGPRIELVGAAGADGADPRGLAGRRRGQHERER